MKKLLIKILIITAVVFAMESVAGHPVSLRTLGVGNVAFAASGAVLDFDGSDYLKVADAVVLDQNDRFSLSILAKPDSAGDAYIIYRTNAYYLKLTSSCTVEGAIYYSSAWQTITSSAISCNGSAWTHIELTYDKDAGGTDELKLYLNGALSAVGDHSTAVSSTNTDLYIGAQDSTPTLPFDGKIDDLRLYQYARTADEVRSDYNDGLAAHLGKNNQRNDGLVVYWNFEEGSGQTVYDRSGNGNDGTLGSSTAVEKSDPVFVSGHDSNGPGGTGLQFDGVDDYVDAGDSDNLDIAMEITLEAWIKPNDIQLRSIMLKRWAYEFYTDDASKLNFAYYTGTYHRYVSNSVVLIAGQWNYVAVSFRANNSIELYVNGEKVIGSWVSGDGTENMSVNTQSFRIAYYNGTSSAREFDGIIDEVRIYNRALSADEIRMHYNQKNPVLRLKMDEGSGTTVHDESFNDNDGTIYGAQGTAESGTASTLTDTNKSWTTDEWKDETIEIISGTGSGQTRTVSSNTADTITVTSNWTTTPDSTSVYRITSKDEWTTGKYGSAIDFDGVDDYVEITDNSSLDITNEITIETWFNTEDSWNGRTILGKDDAYILYFGYPNKLVGYIYSGGWKNSISVQGLFTTNKWYHFSMVYKPDYGHIKLYLNGKELEYSSRSSISGNINTNSNNFYVGKAVVGNAMRGNVDDVRIYNYARTADEILADYNNGLSAYLR